MIGKLLQIEHTLVYRCIREFGKSLPEPRVSGDVKEREFDEMWHFVDLKKKKLWVLKAVDCGTRKTVA